MLHNCGDFPSPYTLGSTRKYWTRNSPTFLFLVEFLALPCTIVVFCVLSISLLDGFWYLFGLELFRMVLVCSREAVWIRRGLPGTAKDAR